MVLNMCTLLRCNGSYQERDEQYKMVLVCNRISVWFSICSILMYLPDRYIDHNRYIRYWNCCCFCTCNRSFISVIQTLQRERYIKSKCKRHGRRKISTASKVAAVCVDMAAIFITRRKTRRKILCSCRGTCYAGIAGIFLRKTRRIILWEQL